MLLTVWHGVELQVDADAGSGGSLGRGAGNPRGAEILETGEQPVVREFQTGLDHLLSCKRIADLDRRPLRLAGRRVALVFFREAGGCQRRSAADAVASCGGTEQDGGIADGDAAGKDQVVGFEQAKAHDVDKRVRVEARFERHLATQRGNPDSVAVPSDSRHHLAEQVAVVRVFEVTEPNLVPQRDGPCPHAEHVAQYPTDTRGGALVWLHERRMVVALNAERREHPVAEIDNACAPARTDDDPFAFARKNTEVCL